MTSVYCKPSWYIGERERESTVFFYTQHKTNSLSLGLGVIGVPGYPIVFEFNMSLHIDAVGFIIVVYVLDINVIYIHIYI